MKTDMQVSERELSRAYEPYRKEAWYTFVTTTVVMIVCALVILPWGIHVPGVYLVLGIGYLGILLLEAVSIFRTALLSGIEMRRGLYVRVEIRMTSLRDEFIPSGKYASIIPKLYPKELQVEPHKIKCVGADNNKLTLRSAMRAKHAQLLIDEVWDQPERTRTVLYGKYTHVIVKYCDKDDTAFLLNRMV